MDGSAAGPIGVLLVAGESDWLGSDVGTRLSVALGLAWPSAADGTGLGGRAAAGLGHGHGQDDADHQATRTTTRHGHAIKAGRAG